MWDFSALAGPALHARSSSTEEYCSFGLNPCACGPCSLGEEGLDGVEGEGGGGPEAGQRLEAKLGVVLEREPDCSAHHALLAASLQPLTGPPRMRYDFTCFVSRPLNPLAAPSEKYVRLGIVRRPAPKVQLSEVHVYWTRTDPGTPAIGLPASFRRVSTGVSHGVYGSRGCCCLLACAVAL